VSGWSSGLPGKYLVGSTHENLVFLAGWPTGKTGQLVDKPANWSVGRPGGRQENLLRRIEHMFSAASHQLSIVLPGDFSSSW
jgi:hypothetical protein